MVCLAVTIGCGDGASEKRAAPAPTEKAGNEICQIAAELFGMDRSKINVETSLGELGADELDLVELVIHLEDHFGVSIPDESVHRVIGGEDFQQGIKNVTIAKLALIVDEQKLTRQPGSLQPQRANNRADGKREGEAKRDRSNNYE